MNFAISQNQPILITGAAGMIGSCLVKRLNDLGYTNLILVDTLGQDEKWKNLRGKLFSDLISPFKIFDYLKGREGEICAYIHLGACSDTLQTDADFLLENNFHFTTRLASVAMKENKRFIYASSAATYGDGLLGFDDDESKLSALMPLNMYGYSKHMTDLWMQKESLLESVVGLKYFNVFGPNEYHKKHMASWILKASDKVLKNGKVTLFKSNCPKSFADGDQKRDFIYVLNAVDLTLRFLEKPYFNQGGIYNIGTGKPTSWNTMAKHLFAAFNLPENIEFVDMPEELSRQYQNYTCANMQKLSSLFQENFSCMEMSSAVYDYINRFVKSKSYN